MERRRASFCRLSAKPMNGLGRHRIAGPIAQSRWRKSGSVRKCLFLDLVQWRYVEVCVALAMQKTATTGLFCAKSEPYMKKNPALIGIKSLLATCLLFTGGLVAKAQTGVQDEVWFSIRTDGVTGTGTLADPYDGSGSKFSDWLNWWVFGTTRSNLTIRLLPGTYQSKSSGTSAGIVIPLNSKIVGAGLRNTTIRMQGWTNPGPNTEYSVMRTHPSSDYGAVSDVTIDANWGGTGVGAVGKGGNLRFQGVQIAQVERVKFIGYGSTTNNGGEVFPLLFMQPGSGNATFGVRNSIFEGASAGAGYASLLTIWNTTNTTPQKSMTNCSVSIVDNVFQDVPNSFAINIQGANGIISGNYFQNINRSIYIDTGFANHFTIRDNRGVNVVQGVCLNAINQYPDNPSSYSGLTDTLIENNVFDIAAIGSVDSQFPPCGVMLSLKDIGQSYTTRRMTNVIVRANVIAPTVPNRGSFKTNWWGVHVGGPASSELVVIGTSHMKNIQFIDNIISEDLSNRVLYNLTGSFSDGVTVMARGNRAKETGLPLHGFPDKIYIWIGSGYTNDVSITEDMIAFGAPQVHVGFGWISSTNQGVRIPQPAELRGMAFKLTVSRYANGNAGFVPVRIAGQGTSVTQFYDPSSGGNYDATLYPNMFFLQNNQAFAQAFYSLDTTSSSIRYGAWDLHSDGNIWHVSR